MTVREDAIKLRSGYEKEKKNIAQWKYGKDTCEGYGVEGLLSYFEYNPPGTKNNKSTNGTGINVVVVTTWRGKSVTAGKEAVLLTSLPVNNAAAVASGYRQRSLIENRGFRELKQAAYLKYLPRRNGKTTENAAYLHIMLCVFAHTFFYAFLGWRKKKRKKDTNIVCLRKWRREESINEKKTILVISEGKYYTLFDICEILDILGVEQKYRIRMNC